MSARIQSFREFWPFYLSEHGKPGTRLLHFVGTSAALLLILLAIAVRWWPLALMAISCGYAFAWTGHFLIEKNLPATFKYPLWSFVGDWKMWAMMLSGRLEGELRRLGLKEHHAA